VTAPTEAPAAVEPIGQTDDGGLRVRFPVVVIEGLDTSDGRFLAPGSLSHRALPLSVLAQPASSHGGDQPGPAQVIGRIDTLTRTPGPQLTSKRTGQPFPDGTFVWSGEGVIDPTSPIADLVRNNYLRGVSVDLTGMDFEVVGENGFAPDPNNPRRQIVTNAAEIAAITLVPIPAFGDCYCELAGEDGPPAPVTPDQLPEGMVASVTPMWRSAEIGDENMFIGRTKSGAVSAEARAEAHKKGHTLPDESFPINNGDDLDNAIRDVGRAKDPAAARKHIIRQAKRLGLEDRIPDEWKSGSMTAAGALELPPIEWFRDPGLDRPTIPPVVTDDGRVYGHVAAWESRHIGYPNSHVSPPRSRTDYAHFHTAGVRVIGDDGEAVTIPVGHIALDTGHAGLDADYRSAAAHYDNTGSLVADVCAGEDEHGIWIAGAVVPGIDEIKLHKLRSCGLSGDWRRIGSGLEMVAAISVPTPGFAVPRARVASGQPLALVAAGALHPGTTIPNGGTAIDYNTLADVLAARLDQREQDRRNAAEFAALVSELDDTHAVIRSLLAQVDDTPQEVATLIAELESDAAFDIGRMPPQLRESYLHGKAAAKIMWGSPGDFKRCELEAAHHGIPERMRAGMCATLHKEATGAVPGKAPAERAIKEAEKR